MTSNTEGRLELSWFNKDKALIPKETGRYGYTWVDPRDPRYCETRTLIKDEYVEGVQQPKQEGVIYGERADLEPTTDNLLILGESGDVLEALTRVPELANRYVGKVKCIYIDPPFNTGELFANYEDNLEHSVWLTMMRDRLVHMRRLLSDDGSIWVHLDDAEVHRMRVLLDEIFGTGNFVAEVAWQKSDTLRNDSSAFSRDFDYILTYRKSDLYKPNKMPRPAELDSIYSSPDGDPFEWLNPGPTAPGTKPGKMQHPSVFGIQHPLTGEMLYPMRGRCWAWGQLKLFDLMNEWATYTLAPPSNESKMARIKITGIAEWQYRDDIFDLVLDVPIEEAREHAEERYRAGSWPEAFFTGKNGYGALGKKTYIPNSGVSPRTWWPNSEVGSNRSSKAEIKALFPGQEPFSTPKPERLLERIIHIGSNPGDIILDVFAGSGTTAAVAHKMGRRWITCELIEDSFNRFTRPRVEKAVRGEDLGGITRTEIEERIPQVDLPGDMDPATAWSIDRALDKAAGSMEARVDITTVLSKAVRKDAKSDAPSLDDEERKSLLRLFKKFSGSDEATMDLLPVLKKTLVDQLKTMKAPDVVNWRGGGGFQVAHLSPVCFDYDPEFGIVTLTEAARNEEHLRASVAAHFGFRRTPDDRHFHGVRGSMRLYVTRTPITPDTVTTLAARLAEGESLTVASTVVVDGSAEALRAMAKGSRVIHIPSDLFPVLTKDER